MPQPTRKLLELSLTYHGNDADDHEVDLYDLSEALQGLHRSLAITTHAVLNGGTIITQAPSLKGAVIHTRAPRESSFDIPVLLQAVAMAGVGVSAVAAGSYKLLTTKRETLLGYFLYSALDAVHRRAFGKQFDEAKLLGEQWEDYQERAQAAGLPPQAVPHLLTDSQIDNIAEKVEFSLLRMHRPIVQSRTANSARISARLGGRRLQVGPLLTESTAEYLKLNSHVDRVLIRGAFITSYNANTFKGRVFVPALRRTINFTIHESARDDEAGINRITASLKQFASDPSVELRVTVAFSCSEIRSHSGRLKHYMVRELLDPDDAADAGR